ncbi:hypothetical protein N7476_006436 [Penicillium atrosanguineum]|uniref:Transcription factor domain-containing protein n=1 Tax=Penicillium atrosanguineum TaxID=1132637 RepID=A0A9W9U5F0_9EURO|nr:hypothetical protein N7476_006436 [Penicillium atrosanguineum]
MRRLQQAFRQATQITHEVAAGLKRAGNKSPFTPSSFQNHIGTSNDDTSSSDSALVTSTNLTGIDAEFIDWNIPDIEFGDLLNSEINENVLEQSSSGLALTDYTMSTPTVDQIQATTWSLPLPISSPRILNKRSDSRPGAQIITTHILHTLKSYLLTMLRRNSLPPFIHPASASAAFDMEPLDNCINLVHMISSGIKGSRKLFWRNVVIECERLRCEPWELSNWKLLAGMQAMSIYILIRLDEGETEHNDIDSLLIGTFAILALQTYQNDIASHYRLDRSWKDWLYEESRRRLSLIYRVINMLVYFEPVAMCNLPKDLVLAPLPAKKELWEASDESMWTKENENEREARGEFGLAKSGELVRLGGDSRSMMVHTAITSESPPRSSASWEEWCSGMDGFGGLVMLAASLVVG